MTLLRRVLGDTLRGRRLRQRRTLREVSGAARVSLGYLSEVERGQKEASSELLASICDALDVRLSDLLSEVSETMRRSERAAEVARMPGRVTIPAPARPARRPVPAGVGAPAPAEPREKESSGAGPEAPTPAGTGRRTGRAGAGIVTRPGIRATSAARSERRIVSETSDRRSDSLTPRASQMASKAATGSAESRS